MPDVHRHHRGPGVERVAARNCSRSPAPSPAAAEQADVAAAEDLPDRADDVPGDQQRQGQHDEPERRRPSPAAAWAARRRCRAGSRSAGMTAREQQLAPQRVEEPHRRDRSRDPAVPGTSRAVPEELVVPEGVLDRVVHHRHHRHERPRRPRAPRTGSTRNQARLLCGLAIAQAVALSTQPAIGIDQHMPRASSARQASRRHRHALRQRSRQRLAVQLDAGDAAAAEILDRASTRPAGRPRRTAWRIPAGCRARLWPGSGAVGARQVDALAARHTAVAPSTGRPGSSCRASR